MLWKHLERFLSINQNYLEDVQHIYHLHLCKNMKLCDLQSGISIVLLSSKGIDMI